MNMDELHENVREWGAEKGLHEDPGGQFEKLGEELAGELPFAHGIWQHAVGYGDATGEPAKVKDAIGDSLVVLHQFCAGHDLELTKCLYFGLDAGPGEDLTEDTWGTLGWAYGRLGRVHAQIEAEEATTEHLREPVSEIVEALRTIAGEYGFPLSECLAHAWSEIEDREGELREGVFVKEEDLE